MAPAVRVCVRRGLGSGGDAGASRSWSAGSPARGTRSRSASWSCPAGRPARRAPPMPSLNSLAPRPARRARTTKGRSGGPASERRSRDRAAPASAGGRKTGGAPPRRAGSRLCHRPDRVRSESDCTHRHPLTGKAAATPTPTVDLSDHHAPPSTAVLAASEEHIARLVYHPSHPTTQMHPDADTPMHHFGAGSSPRL